MSEAEKDGDSFGMSELNRNGLTITVGSTGAAPVSAEPDEWVRQAARLKVGDRLHGKVVNFKPYGFFVETDEKFFGLVHGSQIAGWDWHRRFDETFRLGQEVEVEITKIDLEAHRMAFAYEMTETASEVEPDAPAEPELPLVSHADAAGQWTAEHPEESAAARAWLRTELEEGPLYGPLANLLSDRFDVPVPVSFWIRQFPEFVCFSGKGDNPRNLPAVALLGRSGDAAYWENFKSRAAELVSSRSHENESALRYGQVAVRLNAAEFPGSRWIREYMARSSTLADSREFFCGTDTAERLVIPLLEELGWDTGAGNPVLPRLVRGGRDALGGNSPFDLCLYAGAAGEGRLALAVVCAAAGTSFRALGDRGENPSTLSARNVIERTLGSCNLQRGFVEDFTRVVWTDGLEWVVFSKQALARRIGILSDRQGAKILAETADNDENDWFRRIVLPMSGEPFDWLVAFADLQTALGAELQPATEMI